MTKEVPNGPPCGYCQAATWRWSNGVLICSDKSCMGVRDLMGRWCKITADKTTFLDDEKEHRREEQVR